jgi:hypothetical protein
MSSLKEKIAKIAMSIGATGLIILFALIIIVGPFIGLWAINTLFHVNTAYTFWSWLASLLFFGQLHRSSVK